MTRFLPILTHFLAILDGFLGHFWWKYGHFSTDKCIHYEHFLGKRSPSMCLVVRFLNPQKGFLDQMTYFPRILIHFLAIMYELI